MKKVLPKVIIIVLILYIGFNLVKDEYENIKMERWTKADGSRTHYSGMESKYIALGKETNGNNFYIIYQNNRGENYDNHLETVPSIYAIDIHMIQKVKTLYKSVKEDILVRQKDRKDFKIKLYSLETGEVVKEINANKLLEEKYPGTQIERLIFDTLSNNGRPCLAFYIEDRPESVEQWEIDTMKRVCIDLETEEIFELEKEGTGSPMDRKLDIFYNSTILENNGLMDIYGYSYFVAGLPNWEGTCSVDLAVSCLPKEDVKLYRMFPGLKEKAEEIAKKGGESRIDIFLTGDPTEEEIMRLFLPEGRKISFENVWISGEHSIDGEDHKVGSFEEYQKYLKEFDNVAKVSPIFESRP